MALSENTQSETQAAAESSTVSSPPQVGVKAQAAPKAKKEKKLKNPRVKAAHPPTSEMVNNAIKALKERGGSSLQAIKKYVAANYKVDAEKVSPFIKKYLRAAVTTGTLVQTKGKGASGSFKLAVASGAAVKAASKSPSKTAAAKKGKAAGAKKTTAAKKAAVSATGKTAVAKKAPASPSTKAAKKVVTAAAKKASSPKAAKKVAAVKAAPKSPSKAKKTKAGPTKKPKTPKPKTARTTVAPAKAVKKPATTSKRRK